MDIVVKIIPLISAVIGGLTLIIGYGIQRRHEHDRALTEKKRETYSKFLEAFYESYFLVSELEQSGFTRPVLERLQHIGPGQSREESIMTARGSMAKELALWRTQLALYASKGVLKCFAELLRKAPEGGESFRFAFADLLLEMRLDTARSWRESVLIRLRRDATLKNILDISPLK